MVWINYAVPRLRRGPFFVVLVIVVTLLMLPSWGANLPCCPAGDPSVGVTRFHQIMVLQGDDPNTPEEEPRDRIQVIDRTYWSIPWNNSEVYTYLHPDAQDISVDHVNAVDQQGTSVYLPGEFSADANPADPPATGWTSEGNYASFYYWRFPEAAQRGRGYTLDVNSTLDLRQYDEEKTTGTDWDTSGGMLMLLPHLETSTYVSGPTLAGMDLLTVDMSLEGQATENMTFSVSQDNGTTWTPISVDGPLELPGDGGVFRWMVTFTQHDSMTQLPALERVTFDLLYTPESNDIWLETSYTLDIPEDGLEFDFTLPFDGDGTGFIVYVYTDEDMPFGVNGTDVEQTVDQSYEGKTVHRHLSGDYASLITLAMDVEEKTGPEDPEPGRTGPFVWVLLGLVVLLVALLGLGFLKGPKGRTNDDQTEESLPDD
jgi:hypothetical protein